MPYSLIAWRMAEFKYSLQARLAPGEPRDIGVMVWSDDTLDYFAVRGDEDHALDMNGRIAESRRAGRTIGEFVDYFLERHGGHFYSMARPETVEADSPRDAARMAGARWDLDVVVPEIPGRGVDPAVVRELLAATEGGADLRIRGAAFDGRGRAFVMGFGALGDTVVFAYLPFPYDFSPLSRARFYLTSVRAVEGGWVLRGRDSWRWELGDLDIEVRPIVDPVVLGAILTFLEGLDEGAWQEIVQNLRVLTDPQVV
ncbi:MAG: hypothetical protein FJ087_03070 [Deltaproteobacteria bacterium]|nr:hypothetical protein [Deltaproteobacteria bacterium]